MTLTLREVETGTNPFEDHPQLRSIWPEEFQTIAEDITEDELVLGPTDGPILLIEDEGEVIGITGAFVWPDNFNEMGLRWTGIVPERRRDGVATLALAELIEYVKSKDYTITALVELLPNNDYGDKIKPFFKSFGFEKRGEPEYFDWLGTEGQEYVFYVE